MTAVCERRMERIAREVTGVAAPENPRWVSTPWGTPRREPADVFSWRSFRDRRGWPTGEGWHVYCGACVGVDIYVRERGIGGGPRVLFVAADGLVAAELWKVKDAREVRRTAHSIVKADMIARLQARAARLLEGRTS